MRKTTIVILFCGVLGYAQQPTPKPSQKPAPTKISVAFSRAAIKALLTIQRGDKQLIDAAMVDLNAEASAPKETNIATSITVLEVLHHDPMDGHECIEAWVPKLRARSATIPASCP